MYLSERKVYNRRIKELSTENDIENYNKSIEGLHNRIYDFYSMFYQGYNHAVLRTCGKFAGENHYIDNLDKKILNGIELTRKSVDNLTAFRTANPHVKMRNRPHSNYEYEVLMKGGEYGRRSKYSGNMIDHGALWKCGEDKKDVFLLGEPYSLNWDSGCYSVKELRNDLIAKALPNEYSWYYPGWTYLVFVGRPDIIESLDLDYQEKKAKQVDLRISHAEIEW